MNMDVLSFIQCSLWRYLVWVHLSQCAQHLAPLLTLHTSDMPFRLFHWKLTQTAHCVMHFSPCPVFHFAMECFMCAVKKPSRVEQCSSAAPWPAPSLNLILAVLKIVCIPCRTDRPLFPKSLCCSRCWKRPLCTNSTAPSAHEIFTG